MAVTRVWKIYGVEGHRQRESFNTSYTHDWSDGDNTRVISVKNSDLTGTNDYSVVEITRNTALECEKELLGQVSDGIFENSRVGQIIEVMPIEKEPLDKQIRVATGQRNAAEEDKSEKVRDDVCL